MHRRIEKLPPEGFNERIDKGEMFVCGADSTIKGIAK